MPGQIGFLGFNNFRQLAEKGVNYGRVGEKNYEKIYLLLLHYFHTFIYFGQNFTEFDQFDKKIGSGTLENKSDQFDGAFFANPFSCFIC